MAICLQTVGASIQDELARDDALLALGYKDPILRFWELGELAVVLGRGKSIDEDVFEAACVADQVPIVRRSSGGGTVLQGPGSFNYSLILPMTVYDQLQTISDTNRFIMNRHRDALQRLEPDLEVSGITDLAIRGKKLNGNAQRRSKTHILFHGCFLMDLDLDLIGRYLKIPIQMPSYRQQRSHHDFLRLSPFSRSDIQSALSRSWGVENTLDLAELVAI